MKKTKVAITQGDTSGIGLEIILKTLQAEGITELFTPIVYASKPLFNAAISDFGIENFKYNDADGGRNIREGRINLVAVGKQQGVSTHYGHPCEESGRNAFEALRAASDALKKGEVDVLVTAPIDKHAIHGDDFKFPGHTEYLQDVFAQEGNKARMILFNDEMKIALLTTHLPLKDVAASVTEENIIEAIKDLDKTLRRDFVCERPKIAVLALNPHSGDAGLLGNEEQTVILPAIGKLREEGYLVFGPYPADGFFGNRDYKNFDAVLAMYHDQGLAPFKALAGATGVNYTAGLPIIRTSPDHGTASDIAGQGKADPQSLRHAIYKAIDIANARKRYDEFSGNPLEITIDRNPKKQK